MMEESLLQNILKKKQNSFTEIEIHLFEYCNLSCKFCGQDHNSKLGFESIPEKAEQTISFMKKNLLNDHIVNVMGGEIFNDLIPDELFDEYFEFAQKIFNYANETKQSVTLNWVTNLIFKKTDRIDQFLKKLDAIGFTTNLSTSYDFDGRGYAGNANSIFAKNLRFFKNKVYTIGFVLTKPSIKNLLSKKDLFFEELYKEYPLYFDYYVPEERNCDELMPSDQELLEAFLFVAKKYPKISPINDWLENESNKMTCYSMNKVTVLPSGREVTCRYLDYKDNSFENPINYNSNSNIIASYIDKSECLKCEFFERCSFRCFVQADWVKREKLPECLYKVFFRKNRI